ncbi:MAG TPA: hypothetical protein VKA23_00785 [Mariprofundaceae bacterium]|nr:hypothetical protein [Mariprofundaceae bacterium]
MSDNNWHVQETYHSMIEYGQGMLRFAFLSNGASVIAILTFIGDLSAKSGEIPDMRAPLCIYLIGVISAGLSGMAAYFVQFTLFNESVGNTSGVKWNSHTRWLFIALGLISLSVISFAIGSFVAVSQLQ